MAAAEFSLLLCSVSRDAAVAQKKSNDTADSEKQNSDCGPAGQNLEILLENKNHLIWPLKNIYTAEVLLSKAAPVSQRSPP